MKSKLIVVGIAVYVMFLLNGCYSCARYEANVRPDTVKPSAAVTGKYRLERVILNKSEFVNIGAATEDEYVEMMWWIEASKIYDSNNAEMEAYVKEVLQEINWQELIKELEEPKAFDAFVHKYAKELPQLHKNCIKLIEEYHTAVDTDDAENKSKIIKDTVFGYSGNKGFVKLANAFRKGDPKAVRLWKDKSAWMQEWKIKNDYKTTAGFDSRLYKSCEKMFFDAVHTSLLKNYPNVFTTSQNATPVTVLVSFENKFENPRNSGLLLFMFGYPYTQEIEVTYRIHVVPNAIGENQDKLWKEFADSELDYPPAAQNGGAVRIRNMWMSFFIPISLLGVPGRSDWPQKRTLFENKNAYSDQYDAYKIINNPIKYMKTEIFDPVCDGDIIAALIMRSLNKMAEAE